MDYSLRPYSGVIRRRRWPSHCLSTFVPVSGPLSLSLSLSRDRILRRRWRDTDDDDEWLREDRTISANWRHSYPRRIRDQREYRKRLVRISYTCVRHIIGTDVVHPSRRPTPVPGLVLRHRAFGILYYGGDLPSPNSDSLPECGERCGNSIPINNRCARDVVSRIDAPFRRRNIRTHRVSAIMDFCVTVAA